MPVQLTPEIEENVTKKLLYHLEHEVENRLNLSVFSDSDQMSTKLWNGMFRVKSNYVTEFGLIPVPDGYLPADHEDFIDLVSDFIWDFFEHRDVLETNHWGVLDFGTDSDPKFHLILSNRYLRPEEFGEWLLIDEAGNKFVTTETCKKQRRKRSTRRPRDEPQATDEESRGASPANPRRSSSVSGGRVHAGQTRRGTVSSVETSSIDPESVSGFSDIGGERPGSTMTGYMAGSSGGSTMGVAPSTESLPEQILVPNMLLSAIRSQVFGTMAESDDDDNSDCGPGCLPCL